MLIGGENVVRIKVGHDPFSPFKGYDANMLQKPLKAVQMVISAKGNLPINLCFHGCGLSTYKNK